MMDQVGAVILLRDDGAALLQHRDNKPGLRHADMWVFPGGHCEPGEAIETGARREMFEETGYQCDWLEMLASDRQEVPGWPAYNLSIFWTPYDGLQELHCFEGQAVKFVERNRAHYLKMPEFLFEVWDLAIQALEKHAKST